MRPDIINIEFNNIYRARSIILIVKPYCKREMNYSRKLLHQRVALARHIFNEKEKPGLFNTFISVFHLLISGRITF